MKPKLRPDVDILRIGPESYLVTNPSTATRFEVRPGDRLLLRLMDGQRDTEAIREEFRFRFGRPLRRRHLLEFVHQLEREGLLTTSDITPAAPPEPAAKEPAPAPFPLSPDDPGARLNHRFDLLVLLFGWLVSSVWIVPVLAVAAVATVGFVARFDVVLDELLLAVQETSVPFVLVALAIKVAFLDVARALMLGIACRKLGGRVCRFRFALHRGVFPTVACEISAAPANDRDRWTLATIQPWSQLAIASLAGVLWHLAGPETPLRVFFILLQLVGGIGLVFRSLVFLPSDGYRILLQLVEVPRLYERARAEAKAWLTFRLAPEPLTDRERFWFRTYGLGSILLSLLAQATIIGLGFWWLTAKYHGAGAVIALGLCLLWYRQPVQDRLMEYRAFHWIVRHGGKWWIRWPVRLVVLAGVAAIGWIPYNHEIAGECKLVPRAQQGVRSQIEDEIVRIHVENGDQVKAGDLLVTLSGREINGSIKSREAELERSRARLALLEAGEREEDIQIAEREVKKLEVDLEFYRKQVERADKLSEVDTLSQVNREQVRREFDTTKEALAIARQKLLRARNGSRPEEIAEARGDVERIEADLDYLYGQRELLEIRAPISGRIATPYLKVREGQVAERGELIAVIVDTSHPRVEIAAEEAAAALVEPGMAVKVRLTGLSGRLLTGRVTEIDSAASGNDEFDTEPVRTDREVLLERSGRRVRRYHVRVLADLDDEPAGLAPRMTGYGRIVIREEILWQALARPVLRFFRTEVWSWLP